jgi:uncharacterized damage-inducible protein DinB
MVRVEAVLDSWRAVRRDTAQAVEDFPPNELDFKPLPELDSFREIALHILEVGNGFTGLLLNGVEDLSTPEARESRKKYTPRLDDAGAAALAAELRSSVDALCAELCLQPPEFFAGIVTRFDGQPVTRLEMLQFVKEHELTHRAQLFLYLRFKGIVPVTTRRRQAKKQPR